MAKDTFDKLRSILAERESSPYSQDRNKYQEITAQYDNDLYNSPEYKLRQDINNAKSDIWGTSGIGGLVERFSDNFFSTLGNTITGLDLSDTTNQFGKEMTRNATLRMANLPDTVEAPHDKGMGAWLNYFTDINRGAIPQVANVGGSALAMLIPTALTMIPAGRVAGMAMKVGKNFPAVGRAVTALENSGNVRQLLKDLGMGAISGQYEALAEKGAAIDKLEQMGLPHDEAVKQANAVHKENSALLTATNAVQSALANPILRGIIPGFNVVDDIANGVRQVGRMSANAQALRRFANMVPKPITTTGKVAGSIAGNMALNGYEEGVQNQIQSAHTPTIDEDGNFVWKDYQSINDLMNPYQWSDESIRAAEEGAVGAGGLALLGHGAGGVRSKLFNRPNTDVDTIAPQLSDNGIPLYNDQHYIITDTVSNPNATEDTLARLNALAHDYEEQFGEKLMVTSLRRDGNGDSWHDSGQAIDIAGGGLETNQNGEREWLLKRGEELGLTGLDEYAHPSDHATGGHIHFSNHNDGVVAGNEFEDDFADEENTASDSDTFLAKIGMQESGGNYDAVNPDSGAKGKYQIMPYNWQPWAVEAGLDANAEMTPENQEIVARHKLIQYYDKYGEKGALVAWYAGESNAERYVKGETTDVWGREWTAPQDGAPSIQSYVDEALAQNIPNGGRKRKNRKTPNVNTNSTGNEIQSDNATLDDYLKLFDDGNKNSMTYADYERLINNASDDKVLANANKAVIDYTQEGNLDSFTQLTEMIGDDDVDGLRELAKEHARAITIDEQSPNDNEIDNTADVQNEPINTFDFTEAINGLMEIANNGIQEQQVVARQALQSNAPLFVLNTYKQLTSGAPLEQHISEQNNDTVLPQTKLQQQPINDSRGIIEPTPQEQQQVNENVQQEARQQAESLNNNTPLTAQEQATANSVLNSADGVFAPQIKNELFNALRNGDNAGVRRVINGVPDNIPSQADVHQQSMAEIQESIGNARKNVNRAMAEKNLAGFLETLDEVEKEFMEFLDNLFYETGKGFIDVANGLISDVRRSRSEEEREVLINAIEGLATIAGKAKEYEARRNELRRESGVGKAESNRPVRQEAIPSEAGEIAKAYGLQLKERLKQNNVPISEQAIDRSLNSENQNEVEHVVGRLESIAERNNVPVEDIKENKPKTINQQLAEARAEKEELLGGYLKYIDETSGQGVDIIPLNDGSSRGVRSTKNAKWYSEWYQQNKQKHGKMSKKDKLDIAEQMYRGQIETEETAVVNRLSKEEFDKYQAEQKEAIEKLDAINAKIAQLEKAKEETKNNNDKEKIPPKKGASSNAKKKKEPKTTLTQQESREGVESETQGETPSNKNKPVLNRKSESQKSEKKPIATTEDNSKVKMVKESVETVSKAEIVGENIRDDFMSKDMRDTVSTFLPVIRQKLNQFFLSAKPHKDKKHDSIYGGRTIEEVKSKMERLTKSIVNLVDTLSDFTADEKQVMKEVLQSRCKKAIDKAIKQIKDSNTKLAVDTSREGIQEQAKINREKQLELVKTEFPTATNIVQNEDSISFNLNDEKIRVDYVDRVIATEERKQAYRRDYGEEYTDDVSILGDTQTINGEQVITLLNRIGYEDTLSHEAFHLAFRTALTKAQQKILLDKYGNEEAVAEAYRELMNKSNARGTMFDMTSGIGRLFQKIWNFANSLFNVFNNGCMLHDAESIMYAIADGSIYELNEKNKKGIVAFLHPALLAAWHGTPHLFDKFSTEFMGSGEGAQAHGWGVYVSLDQDTANRYRSNLAKISMQDKFIVKDENGNVVDINDNAVKYLDDATADKIHTAKDLISFLEQLKDDNIKQYKKKVSKCKRDITKLKSYPSDAYISSLVAKTKTEKELFDGGQYYSTVSDYIQHLEDDLAYWENAIKQTIESKNRLKELQKQKLTIIKNSQSYLYKVDIPSLDTMLREDKPFSEQPKQVQEALEKMWKDYKDSNTYSYKQNDDKYDVYRGDELLDTYDDEELAKQAVEENTDSTHIKNLSNFTNGREILSYVRENLYYFTHDYEYPSSDKGASLWLNKYGIEGISYDGRQDGECCVIFNDKAVKILERNGEPVNNADEHGVKLRAITNADSQLEAVRKQYEGTDQWMKAPNGKPTNLTERQWLQVRTPNFKEWFGDWENDPKNASKIVDENGEPLVVYHGTPLGGFEVFNRELNYFTADKEYADRYQDPGASSDYVKGVHEELGKAMTYPVFLNIRKPFDTRKAKERKIFEKEFYRQWGNGAPLSEKGLPDWTDSDDFREFFEENDYDYDGLLLDEGGVPTEDGNVKSRGISYVAFKPNQIKSATDNSGEFNTENDNIKYSRAVSNPNSAESLKKNGDTDTRLDKLPKVDYTKLNKTEKDIMKFGKALGIPVHFVTHYDPNYRGVFTHNGEIFINRKATVPAKDIFIHEFVHWLKASGNENIYDSLSACLENINGVSHAKRLSEYRKFIFNGERMTNDEIIEEMICDAMSRTATANRLINDIGKINLSIAEKIVGHMKGLWDKFCNALGYQQGKPISQQSLPNHLSANELAKMDAVLNRQLANIKGKDGKPVFAFKNGKWTVARNGKTVGESYNTNPISATIDRQSQEKVSAERQLEAVRKQYEGTDQWMKAPNGKPTNLTERQWLQVRTPNFKNWFGDWENDTENASKVVDENGEPKVMYHGTDALFDVFKRVTPKHGLNSGDGFYFTESKNVAESFGNKVLECFLNIRKPFDTTSVPTESKTFSKQNKEKAIEFFEQKYSDWEKNGKGYDRFKPQVELLSDGGFTITFATSYQAEVSNANDGVFNHEVVVFNPNQIKSATENNGEFNTENDNIKYSRSKPTDDTLSSDTQGLYQRATTALLKRLGFEKENDNVRVDRKSSNPNNLNIFNRFINSPSFLARYNKIVAPFVALGKQAVEKQEKLRTEFREELNDIEKILGYKEASRNNLTGTNDPKYKERKEALNTILFNGDVEGKEYTAKELSEKGHDKETIKAYLKMRKLLNRAYDLLDRTVRQVKIGARNMTDGELADLKAENPFIEIVSVNDVEGDKKRKRYTYRYPTVERKTEQLLSSDIKELKQNSDVKVISIKKLSGERYEVEYIQRRSLNKIKGYVPHMFHEWAVVEVDKDGKILKDENGNSKFLQTFDTMNEAIKYANKSDKKGYYRVMPKVHEVAGASERAFIMEDYNYFEKIGKIEEDFLLTPEEATEIANGDIRTSNRGRFLGNLMKRKGVKNYEKDLLNATYQYLNQVGRYVALDPYKRLSYALYERNFGKWGNEKVYMGELGQTAKYIRTYINAINGVPNNVEMALNNALHTLGIGKEVANGRPALWFIHWLTYPMTILKLGMVNVSSALLNVTQLCNTFGAMGDISLQNIKRLSKNAAVTYWKAWKDHNSNEGKLLWDELGLKTQLGMDVAGGYSKAEVDGLANLQGKISKLAGKSMFLFRGTDSFGRGVTLLTAYQKAIDEGKSHKEAIRYAKMVNTRVNFDYSVADANGIYNRLGAVANLILQFQKYPMKQLELFYDIFKEQKEMNKDKNFTNARAFGALLKYTAPYMALSGIAGVPFISLAGSLLGFVSGDDDKDLVAEFRAMLRNNFGDNAITRVLGYGALGIIDINTGSRIGVGDFLGGNANMKKTKVEIFAETVGGTTVSTALQIGKQLWNENYLEALKALNPSIGNVFIGLRGEVRTTRGRLKYTYANGYEQFIRGLGFTPVGETLASELASEDYKNRQKEQEAKKEAIDKFLANPSAENAKLLNDLGITPKSLKTERERKNKTSHEINQEKEKKKKEKEKKIQKKKVYSVNDYQKAVNDYQKEK